MYIMHICIYLNICICKYMYKLMDKNIRPLSKRKKCILFYNFYIMKMRYMKDKA